MYIDEDNVKQKFQIKVLNYSWKPALYILNHLECSLQVIMNLKFQSKALYKFLRPYIAGKFNLI
jgi:hypothetical protein